MDSLGELYGNLQLKLDRPLSEKERQFLKWMYARYVLEQKESMEKEVILLSD